MTFRKTTKLTKEQIKKVLPEVISYRKLIFDNSMCNLLYELKDDKRDYILRCSPPDSKNKTENEVAVIKFLKGKIPVPKIYKYSFNKDEIGLEYMLMEKVKGNPLSDTWYKINKKQRLEYTKQIAKIFVKMKKHSFKKIGSFDIDMNVVESVENQDGPYNNFKEYITAKIKKYVGNIKDNKEYVPKFKKYLKTIKNYRIPLALTHTDICPKNMMADKGKITALLDYEWSTNAPYMEDIMNITADLELDNHPECKKEFFKILKRNKIPYELKDEIKEIYEISAMAMRLAYYKDWFYGKPKQAKKFIEERLKELDKMFEKVGIK